MGRSTFELAKRFNQVVGIDFSHGFIDACNKLKMYGKLAYTVQTEGSLVSEHTAEVDPDIVGTPCLLGNDVQYIMIKYLVIYSSF